MRTTFTVDPDLAPRLERARKKQGASMARIINALLRSALDRSSVSKRKTRFKTRLRIKGRPLVPNLDDVSGLLAFAEGEDHR